MSTAEQRIAAALTATAEGITMSQTTIEERFTEVRQRGEQDRRRRRVRSLGAGAAALAAGVAAVLVLTGGLLDGDERALPDTAEAPQELLPMPRGAGDPAPGRYFAADATVPFEVSVPDKGEVPGGWHYELGDGFWLSLDRSVATGHANVGLARVEQVYVPGGPVPYAKDAPLQAAPTDADGWVAWLEATGVVEVVERTQVEVDGADATRLTLEVAQDIAPSGFPCAPGESCLALAPDGPSVVGGASEGAFTSELTLVPVGDELLVSVALGRSDSADQWLPLMRSVVESLDFR